MAEEFVGAIEVSSELCRVAYRTVVNISPGGERDGNEYRAVRGGGDLSRLSLPEKKGTKGGIRDQLNGEG